MYPIENFLRTKIKQSGFSIKEIAQLAGYKNISKAIRRLEEFIQHGTGCELLSRQLPEILGITWDEIEEKTAETARLKAAEAEADARAAYTPYLFAVTERTRPLQICICGLTGMHKRRKIELPREFNQLPEPAQASLIRDAIRNSLALGNGEIPFFGKILRFVLSRTYDEPQDGRNVYDRDGNLVAGASHQDRVISEGILRITLG